MIQINLPVLLRLQIKNVIPLYLNTQRVYYIRLQKEDKSIGYKLYPQSVQFTVDPPGICMALVEAEAWSGDKDRGSWITQHLHGHQQGTTARVSHDHILGQVRGM